MTQTPNELDTVNLDEFDRGLKGKFVIYQKPAGGGPAVPVPIGDLLEALIPATTPLASTSVIAVTSGTVVTLTVPENTVRVGLDVTNGNLRFLHGVNPTTSSGVPVYPTGHIELVGDEIATWRCIAESTTVVLYMTPYGVSP